MRTRISRLARRTIQGKDWSDGACPGQSRPSNSSHCKSKNFSESASERLCPLSHKACAGILIIVSAITVGFVNSNDDFQREGGRNFQSIRQLDRLVDNTLSTAVWLLILSAIVLVWEGAQSTIAVATPRVGFLQRYSVVLTITVRELTLQHFHNSTKGIVLACVKVIFSLSLSPSLVLSFRMQCSVSWQRYVSWAHFWPVWSWLMGGASLLRPVINTVATTSP